jgi:hypothetical protein
MRSLSWLVAAATSAVGYLVGTATSNGVAVAPDSRTSMPVPCVSSARDTARRAGAASPDADLARALRRLSATMPAPAADVVAAPIRGTVVDGERRPVADVLVRARPEIDAPDDDDDVSIEEVAARRLAWLHAVRDGTQTAVTRSDGTFQIGGVRGGLTYELDVRTDGLVLDESASSSTSPVHPGDAVSFVVERRCALIVRVDGASDVPVVVETAATSSDGKPDYSAQRWSLSRPTLWVRPGTFLIRATSGDSVTDVVTATVDCGSETEARLSLAAGGRIDCDVAWPHGLERAAVDVTATRAGGPSAITAVAGELQADGRVTLRRLLPGRWTVAVAYPSHRVVETRDVDVAAGARIRLHLALPEPDVRDFVVVRVLDEGGAPVTGAHVESTDHFFCSSSDGPRAAESAPGVYRAFHAGRPETNHRFRVYATIGSECVSADYVPGSDAEVVVKLPCTAPLDVRIGAGFAVWDAECGNATRYAAGDDGVAHMGMRRAGDVLLVRSDDPDSMMLVRHPGPDVVQWSPRPLRAWLVEGVKDGAAFDAGLRNEDLIVGVDGEEFRDAPHREAAWAAALARGRCRLDVLRGDESLRVAMDASLFRHDRADAELAPWVR